MKKEYVTAIAVAIAGLLWAILEFVAGFHSSRIELHATVTWFAFVPVILIYTWHYRTIKQQYREKLTWQKGVFSGLLVTGIAIPLNMIGFSLFYYLINPNLFNSFIKYSVDAKLLTVEDAGKYFTLSNYLIQIAIGTLILGILLSVILSLFFKTKAK